MMATVTHIEKRFPAVEGSLLSTVEARVKVLRAAGIFPKSKHGGGYSKAAHLNNINLAGYLISLGAPGPTSAAETVHLLRSLPYRGTQPKRGDVAVPLPTLEDAIADLIDKAAEPYRHGGQWDAAALATLRSLRMQICLNPRHVIITAKTSVGVVTTVYAADPTPEPGLRHLAVVTGDLVLLAAELLADTERRVGRATADYQATLGLNPKNAGPVGAEPASLADQTSASTANDVFPDTSLICVKTQICKGKSSARRSELVKIF